MAERSCQLTVRVELEDPAQAKAVADALEVDNRQAPHGLAVSCSSDRGAVVCSVTISGCEEPSRLLTLRNTVDDLLISARAAIDSIRGLKAGDYG